VGEVPVELLWPVLERMDADALAEFEVRNRSPRMHDPVARADRVRSSSRCASLSRFAAHIRPPAAPQDANPSSMEATSILWQSLCRTQPPPRDGHVDWRALFKIEQGMHRAKLKLSGVRLHARAAAAEEGRKRLSLLDGAEPVAGGASKRPASGAAARSSASVSSFERPRPSASSTSTLCASPITALSKFSPSGG
jgi:hypothetical protein